MTLEKLPRIDNRGRLGIESVACACRLKAGRQDHYDWIVRVWTKRTDARLGRRLRGKRPATKRRASPKFTDEKEAAWPRGADDRRGPKR